MIQYDMLIVEIPGYMANKGTKKIYSCINMMSNGLLNFLIFSDLSKEFEHSSVLTFNMIPLWDLCCLMGHDKLVISVLFPGSYR